MKKLLDTVTSINEEMFHLRVRYECHYFIKSMFGSVVVVAFQITFRAEMHVNDVFLYFKNHF